MSLAKFDVHRNSRIVDEQVYACEENVRRDWRSLRDFRQSELPVEHGDVCTRPATYDLHFVYVDAGSKYVLHSIVVHASRIRKEGRRGRGETENGKRSANRVGSYFRVTQCTTGDDEHTHARRSFVDRADNRRSLLSFRCISFELRTQLRNNESSRQCPLSERSLEPRQLPNFRLTDYCWCFARKNYQAFWTCEIRGIKMYIFNVQFIYIKYIKIQHIKNPTYDRSTIKGKFRIFNLRLFFIPWDRFSKNIIS